jgi:hypothetical protein
MFRFGYKKHNVYKTGPASITRGMNNPLFDILQRVKLYLWSSRQQTKVGNLWHYTDLIQDTDFYYVTERTEKHSQPQKRVSKKQYIYT